MTLHRFAAGLFLADFWIQSFGEGFQCPPGNFQDKAVAIELAGGQVFLPVYMHEPPFASTEAQIVVITLHGQGRNGNDYFEWVTSALLKHGIQGNVVVISPVFADLDCSAAQWTGDEHATGQVAKWSHSTRQWVFGEKCDKVGDWSGISSYQVIDDLIEYAEVRYKNLKKFVVAGFSAGSQMGLRWAIFSPEGVQGKTLAGIPLITILGSPSSVTYLDDKRPSLSCVKTGDNMPDHNCTDFVEPDNDNRLKTCAGNWNQYAFGIDGLRFDEKKPGTLAGDVADYLHNSNTDDNLLKEILVERFASKTMSFGFGDTDTMDCRKGECASDCEAMLQGKSRLQRGLNFMWYLKWTIPGYEPDYAIFHGGHRPELFFASEHFNARAFEQGGWDECLWDSFTCFSLLWKGILAGVALTTTMTGLIVFLCMRCHIDKHYVKRDTAAPEATRLLPVQS